MAARKVSVEVGDDGVAILTIDNPPVNSLAKAVLNDLYKRFAEISSNAAISAIVITGAHGKFSGGADIRDFQRKQESGKETEAMIVPGVTLINHVIEGGRKPVVAAIAGFALGGGLELAMACHARIATPGARLGLPELQLGIIPGLGGTQRLPRLVGLEKAIDMLLSSRALDSKEGKCMGLIDEVAEPGKLLSVSRRWAFNMAKYQHPWQISLYRNDKLRTKDEALRILNSARLKAKKKYRNVTHPFLCLDVIEKGLHDGGAAGMLMENEISQSLVTTPNARGLMHFFFIRQSVFKVPGITDQGIQARTIRKVGVVGVGLMGAEIATVLILSNITVVLKEVNATRLQEGMNQIQANLQRRVVSGKMTKQQMINSLTLVKGSINYMEFEDVDLVIEAVIEDIDLKQKIFRELEHVCSSDCILASNTSCIDISILGASIRNPERVVGAHFFSHVPVMQLLEVVQTEKTSLQIIVDMLVLAKSLQKIPLVVRSSLGFAANRIFNPYNTTAHFLADLGIDPYRIDSIMKDFGMPMGPFRVADLSGIKMMQRIWQLWNQEFPNRFYQSALPKLMLKDNRLGEVTGKGFYNYDEARREHPTQELQGYLEQSRKLAGLNPTGKTLSLTDEEIVEMIFFPVVNEACRALEESVVMRPGDLDIASVLGMSFPSYRGGIIFWADNLGLSYILNQLTKWSIQYGNIYKPSSILEKITLARIPLGQFSKERFSRL